MVRARPLRLKGLMAGLDTPSIAIIAHDNCKDDAVAWVLRHEQALSALHLYCTGTTGGRIAEAAESIEVTRLLSGPLGGDQQIGALAAEKQLSAIIFFIDPLTAHPHDVDVKALIRLAIVHQTPLALNMATADAVLTHLVRDDATRSS